MKILLAACNAKYIHSNLAVYDLKAYSSDYDKEVFLREYTINQPKDEIKIFMVVEQTLSVSPVISGIFRLYGN